MAENREKKLLIFQRSKHQCLSKEDLSRKNSIDEPIRALVELFNSDDYYFTTSTCSGRVSLIEKPNDNAKVKKGRNILLNKHEEIEFDEFIQTVRSFVDKDATDICLWLKFEPFILHIQSFSLDKAQSLISVAIGCGCRNSGITISKGGKFLVAIRSTSSMEIPIHCENKFKLGDEFLKFLIEECNRRMEENHIKLDKFKVEVERLLAKTTQVSQISQVSDEFNKCPQ